MTATSPMPVPPLVMGRDQATYDALYRSPTTADLDGSDVRALLFAVADAAEGPDGVLHLVRNGVSAELRVPPSQRPMTIDEVVKVRRFLDRSEGPAMPTPMPSARSNELLVVLAEGEAIVSRCEPVGEVPLRLVPFDPYGFGKHLLPRGEIEVDGSESNRKSRFDPLAATLRCADRIVILGVGADSSAALEGLRADLLHYHREVAERVVAALAIDAPQGSDRQLLLKARALFAAQLR